MTFNWKTMGIGLLLVALLLMGKLGAYYHTAYQKEERRADTAEQNLQLANATINDMQVRQREVAALDAKYTGELQDAKANIDQLERDVATGKRRLQLNANCLESGKTSATSMVNGASPSLDPLTIRFCACSMVLITSSP
ncbi:lysis protein, partial [Enterobacter roggenkampii]|uniref:lysis protein n=1 Tax=Enterobacter roggenkampii TaxID=1812935 RepID=UPI0018970B1E